MNDEIAPDRLYDANEVQQILGFKRKKSVYEVPECQLPATWVGPRRGKKMYRGRDLLAYLERGRKAVA